MIQPEQAVICGWLEDGAWLAAQIRMALVEADAGDFADTDDVTALATKWGHNPEVREGDGRG
jgi:predicted transcriptional regulator